MVTLLDRLKVRASPPEDRRLARFQSLTLRHVLLASGVAAPAWWVAMDIVGSFRYPGYSYVDQTISELSAEGALNRTFMILSGVPYPALMVAFGAGVWMAAGSRRAGRVTGALLATEAVFGYVGGLLFPMATREVIAAGGETLRNSLHAPYGMGMPVLFVSAMIAGWRLFGTRFRSFSHATIAVMIVFGILTVLQADELAANEPTPWLGIEERVNAYAAMLWIAVLAIALLREQRANDPQDNRLPRLSRRASSEAPRT
jgi:hypothetical protein